MKIKNRDRRNYMKGMRKGAWLVYQYTTDDHREKWVAKGIMDAMDELL